MIGNSVRLLLCVAPICWGQTGGVSTQFDVASVKLSARGELRDRLGGAVGIGMKGGPGTSDPGQISFTNTSLKTLVALAYGVRRYNVSGPEWLETAGFNIVAKVPANSSKEQVMTMLMNLLTERFKLAAHREIVERPVYLLVVGKGGSKLKPAQDPDRNGFSGSWKGGYRWGLQNSTIRDLVDFLSPRLDRPVLDMTELAGGYDISLFWAPDSPMPPPPADPDGVAEPIPAIFEALQEQLGLKLERAIRPIQLVLVDHAERVPTEN